MTQGITSRKLLHKGEFTELTLCKDSAGIEFVRKTSFYPGSEKLADEARFIRQSLPESARGYFPDIIREKGECNPGDAYYYDMPYYPGTLLRRQISSDSRDVHAAVSDVRNTLNILNRTLYSTKATETPVTFMQKHYIDRIVSRLSKYEKGGLSSQPATKISSLTVEQTDDFFANVIRQPAVTVNGVCLLTPLEILRRISVDDTLRRVICPSPHSMRFIHGDPHLGNIMIRDDNASPLFLDPNGFHTGGDIAYDLGKFLLSLNYLDMLLEGQLISPEIAWNEDQVEVGLLDMYRYEGIGKKFSLIYHHVVTEVLPEVFSNNLMLDPLLIDRSVFAANLHAFACAHTFIPTKQKASAIPLLIHYMCQANEYLEEFLQKSRNDEVANRKKLKLTGGVI